MFNSQWAKKFYANMFAHNLAPGQILYLQRMAAKASNYRFGSMNPPNKEDRANKRLSEDVCALEEHIESIKPYCRRDHALSGVAFLMDKAFTPKGKLRETEDANQFLIADLDVLRDCTGIRFDGLFEYNSASVGYYSKFMANYIVESPYAYFAYRMRPWQRTAYFEIYERGEEL